MKSRSVVFLHQFANRRTALQITSKK